MSEPMQESTKKLLFLDEFHKSYGAKMGNFAGYSMPITYSLGLIQEHLHTRSNAGLFDISHMGQVYISGGDAINFLNKILPVPCEKLTIGKARYTLLLNEEGGIIDDLIITKIDENIYSIVINAECVDKDMTHLNRYASKYQSLEVTLLRDRALLALQGPKSEIVLNDLLTKPSKPTSVPISELTFMRGSEFLFEKESIWVTRNGYTGEDGFEISLPYSITNLFAEKLVKRSEVTLIGLGARNSLRLEAGLSLYGNDIGEHTNPYEANLSFTISKLKLKNTDIEEDFIGAQAIRKIMVSTPKRIKVGILPFGKAPIRENVLLFETEADAEKGDTQKDANVGTICSGGFSPSLNCPIAFAYVTYPHRNVNTTLWANLRGRAIKVQVVELPFIEHNYKR